MTDRIESGIIRLGELASSPASPPPSGHWFEYFLSDGLYVMDDMGAETGPLGSGGGGGDMLAATYDPTGIEASVFDTDNHTDGDTNGVYTLAERTKLSSIETGAEVNNISDANATDLTDGGETTLHKHANIPNDGWVADANTWSYSSADSPTFVISINADMTAILSAGIRIKLTQTTVKYFIVTAVGAYSGGATLVTVYGGTDYTLANAAISSPFYSPVKAPFGFPLSPAKWTVEVTDTNATYQTPPTTNTWYNLGSIAISIPIGAWKVSYQGAIYTANTGSNTNIFSTLSTANNSESDADFSSMGAGYGFIVITTYKEKTLAISSKTSYYLNLRVTAASLQIAIRGDVSKTAIRAQCAYL